VGDGLAAYLGHVDDAACEALTGIAVGGVDRGGGQISDGDAAQLRHPQHAVRSSLSASGTAAIPEVHIRAGPVGGRLAVYRGHVDDAACEALTAIGTTVPRVDRRPDEVRDGVVA